MVVEILLPGGETGYAGKSEEGYYLIPEDASGRRQKAENLRGLIRTIEEKCRVVSGMDLAAIDPEKRKLMLRIFGRDGAESIVLAGKPGHVLWTDDAVVSGFAGQEFGVERVWTQVMLQWMAQAGSLEEEAFYTCSAQLFGWGYQFTSVSSNSLVRAGAMAEWDVNRWPLSKCVELFRYENVDLSALINIAARFLREMYGACAISGLRQAVIVKLLNTLSKRSGGFSALCTIRRLLEPLFGLNVVGAAEVALIFDAWFKSQERPGPSQ